MPNERADAGARLDRLPVSTFHRRIAWLVGVGMFFDGFDAYVMAGVLGATLSSGFSTLKQNGQFVSFTFLGMMVGAFAAGFLGDRYGRRFSYQANLALSGLASVAAAFAPTMMWLIALRFVMGVGLGAEVVAGYSTITEFVPPQARGRWVGWMSVFVVASLPASAFLGRLVIPFWGWRPLFLVAGAGALVVWYLRKALPESPRWLQSVGREAEADAVLRKIEEEVSQRSGPLAKPQRISSSSEKPRSDTASLFEPPILQRMIVGAVALVVINTILYGFVTWLPTFFVKDGRDIVKSMTFTALMTLGAPIGSAIGAYTSDFWGRKPTILGASIAAMALGALYPFMRSPLALVSTGFLLIIPIYVLVSLLFAIYVPELFPTEVRLRASGICNAIGRSASIVTPWVVVMLFQRYDVAGVLGLMISLLALQVVVVGTLGIEPKRLSLEAVGAS
jgi:MFS transporter, putative metabolite:H+ symporter